MTISIYLYLYIYLEKTCTIFICMSLNGYIFVELQLMIIILINLTIIFKMNHSISKMSTNSEKLSSQFPGVQSDVFNVLLYSDQQNQYKSTKSKVFKLRAKLVMCNLIGTLCSEMINYLISKAFMK